MLFSYLAGELRRRKRQAVFISLGLALGVGLAITVTAAASGVQAAQGRVLHALYGVGTDLTVTQSAAGRTAGPSKPQIRSDVRVSIANAFGGTAPRAGTGFSKKVLISSASGLGTLSSSAVTSIRQLPGVAAAGGGLSLSDLDLSGTIPAGAGGLAGLAGQSSLRSTSFSVLGADPAATGVGPLSSARLTAGRPLSGADSGADVALVDADYAAQQGLRPGSSVIIGNSAGRGTSFLVVGLVQPPSGATPADVYIPLARAQALGAAPQPGASLHSRVNTIYVTAASSASIGTVQREISGLLPAASVSSSATLATQVSGSLASTSSLASSLGRWLAVAVLIAAFGVASLLTLGAVSRRVREFGTLKALGWATPRIVSQVLAETVTMGVAGGLAGIILGFAGAAVITSVAPALTATAGLAGSAASDTGRHALAGLLQNANPTVSVHLTAPVTAGIAVAAVLLAVAGGIIAGGLAGWRIARLRPAAALARVE
ncbi:MAG TPA: FtsX-like permease family protein [Streptosporangiaceae bacterium]|jgi:putative ABC transport system permease protein